MKRRYTKEQITEAIAHWKRQLNENIRDTGISSISERLDSWTKETGEYVKNLGDQLDKVERLLDAGNPDIGDLKDEVHLAVLLLNSIRSQFEI